MKKVVLLLGFIFPLCAQAQTSGYCGTYNEETQTFSNNCQYEYDTTTKTLHIYGEGNMSDFGPNYVVSNSEVYRQLIPWRSIGAEYVVIEGVSNIGARAFQGMGYIKQITISDSVQDIGVAAFQGDTHIESINLPANLSYVSDYAFQGVSEDIKIYCQDNEQRNCSDFVGQGFIEENQITKYSFANNRYFFDGSFYKNISDMQKQTPITLKRIYTVEEATKVTKPSGNKIMLRYK